MIPDQIHRRLTQRHGIRSTMPLSCGMSGATLYRCVGEHAFVLRRWPDSTSLARVREIHAAIIVAASTCELFPNYLPIDDDGSMHCVDNGGSIWDLSTWMPGQALDFDATESLIQVGASAIGRAHQALAPLAFRCDIAPAVIERQQRITWLNRRLPACLEKNPLPAADPTIAAALDSSCQLLRRHWSVATNQMSDSLASWAVTKLPLQVVLRDCHREHVLFSDTRATGIIDFDALRIDSPAVDLARWATSFSAFSGAPESTIDAVLAGYAAIGSSQNANPTALSAQDFASNRSLAGTQLGTGTPDFRKLILTLAGSSLWISMANWVIWLVDESRQFPDLERVSQRLSRLVESVDVWSKR